MYYCTIKDRKSNKTPPGLYMLMTFSRFKFSWDTDSFQESVTKHKGVTESLENCRKQFSEATNHLTKFVNVETEENKEIFVILCK